jgi:hypothetical protein
MWCDKTWYLYAVHEMCVMGGVQGKRFDSHGSQARLGKLRRSSGLMREERQPVYYPLVRGGF